jgi:hypothetical protein
MRLGRRKAPANVPIVLPEAGESVTLKTRGGGRIPTRVLESSPESLLLAIMVSTSPLSEAELATLTVEHKGRRGRVVLHGSFMRPDPGDPELLRMDEPRTIEVLQERSFVRIQAARPVLVYSAGGTRVESYTIDISGGGFLLAGPDTIAVGDELAFKLSIAAEATPVEGTGHVVRVDSMGRRAVAIDTISDLDSRRLVRFIFECQRSERRRGLAGGEDGRR